MTGMGHIVQRFGFRIGRGWLLLLLVVGVPLGVAYWVGPLRPLPPELELVTVDGDRAVDALSVRGAPDAESGGLRFAVPLAVRNVGTRPGTPRRLTFSVPGRYRLATAAGVLDGEVTPGVPLRRYVLPVSAPLIRPDEPPQPLRGLETVWLEPDLPSYYCTRAGEIPEFVPAPQFDAAAVADVQLFYSLSIREAATRNTGVLTVRLDPTQLQATPAAMPPTFPTIFEEPEVDAPELGPLVYGGERRAFCGDPEQPMELFTVVWQTAAGGRFYVIYLGDAPRKHLYDLNGDGVIELETWDVDGDGRFEARREARYPVPEFLVPLRRRADLLEPDTVPPDSAWLARFNDVAAGPFRFTRRPAVPDVAIGDPGAPTDTVAPGMPHVALGPLPPPDSAWLALFFDTDAGPFRFTRPAAPPELPGAAPPPVGTPQDLVPGAPGEPDVIPDDEEPEAAPAPPPPPRRVPLGTPVPRRPPGGDDTQP
jgi:hypothetical protein